LPRQLATGDLLSRQHNLVLVGGTGTGKSHLPIALARALIRNGARGRLFNVVDLFNQRETEARNGKQGRLADFIARREFVIMDELGISCLPRLVASVSSIWSAGAMSAAHSP
tara:strand:- start:335 stop:670 length:336 start_codon:yes stop_codon:yes gene_type:complete